MLTDNIYQDMSTGKELIIDIRNPKHSFQRSLNFSGNSRIVFSGPFGSGKTFFLKRFFNETKQFVSLHLYPVNYSVSRNEDIFELIKYDILYELLRHQVTLEKLDVSFVEALPLLDNDEQVKALSHFLSLIPKIGKPVANILEDLKGLMKIIDARRKKMAVKEDAKIKEFAANIEQTRGSIYEVDLYSNLIIDLIRRLRAETKKQVVLVIDDLDRVDPDHIFRILNIFSSHLDLERDEENKFGLDKVIVCCDIDNIRTIFYNKFGQDVDFSGYIDKFYSREIFEFDNRAFVTQSVAKVLASLKIDKEFDAVNYINNTQKLGFSYAKYILVCFVNSNSINLRILLKLYNREYSLHNYFVLIGKRTIRNWQASILILFDFLTDLFGDAKSLKRAIQKTNFSTQGNDELGIRSEQIAHLCGELMLLAHITSQKGTPTQNKAPYSMKLNGRTYSYRLVLRDFMDERYTSYLTNEEGHRLYDPERLDVKAIILKAFDSYVLLDRGFD